MPQPRRIETPKSNTKAEEAELEQGIRVTLRGETYEFRVGDITPQMERRLRMAFGVAVFGLIAEFERDPGLDTVAAVVFLAKLVSGEESVSFDDIQLSYADVGDLDFEFIEDAEEAGELSPEG